MDDAPQPLKPGAPGADNPDVKAPLPMPSRTAEVARLVRVTIGGTRRDWWTALHEARAAGKMPAVLEPLASGADGEVTLTEREWDAVRAWGQSLPGWLEGDGLEQLMGEDATS